MNKIKYLIILLIPTFTACEMVDPGNVGVYVSFGGETDTTKVYPEGMHTGLDMWLGELISYDVRERTFTEVFEFNDKDNMVTKVEIALDFRISPNKANKIHSGVTDLKTKIIKTLKSAGKEVVPQYSAIELNINKRTEAEQKISEIVAHELPEFYIEFRRLQMTDVDIPPAVAKLAEETAVQLGRNELAEKMEAEQVALAKAREAKSKGDYNAALYDAKTKDVMSQPKMLKLKELEIEQTWANKGVSRYGNNNVFGAGTAVIKGLK